MIDINAIESRLKWLKISIAETLAWGLDDNTHPSTLKHCNDTVDALNRELGQLERDLKHANEINERATA